LEIFVKNRYDDYKIKGKIDRIDTRDSVDSVIDYKSGKNVNTNSFQLAFYYLLLKGLDYNAQNFEFYDLQFATLKSDNKIDEKLKLIDEIFNSLKSESYNFSKCEDIKSCLYCKYKIICQRV
jgi:CRISPR/Cas system-associated exonuclease Cas4 (RecB family)